MPERLERFFPHPAVRAAVAVPRLLSALALVAVLLQAPGLRAAASTPAAVGLLDEWSTKQTARLLNFDEAVNARIWPRRDHDFFVVQAPSAGILRIRHAGLAPTVASAVKVHDERATVRRWANGHPGQDHLVDCPVREAGRYWIELADTKDTNYAAKPYTLEVRFDPIVDANEPNDRDERATPLTLPATVEGYLFPSRDQDRFRFYAPGPGCLKLLLTGVDPEAGARIMVLGEGGLKVTGFVESRKLGFLNLLLNINRPGIYQIVLEPCRAALSVAPYRLRAELHATTEDPFEPNDSVAQAVRIYPGQRVQASIMPAQDRDFYRLRLRGVGRLIVRHADLRGGLGSAINVVSPWNVSLTGGWRRVPRGATEHEVQVAIEGWGDYLVEVGDPDSERASLDPYELTCTFLNRQKVLPGQ